MTITWVGMDGTTIAPYSTFEPAPASPSVAGAATTSLRALIEASLFSDALVDASELPEGDDNRRGFWADAYSADADNTGSTLWLLSRAGLRGSTPRTAKSAIEVALQWLIDDGIVAELEVIVSRISRGLGVMLIVGSPDGTTQRIQYRALWEAV